MSKIKYFGGLLFLLILSSCAKESVTDNYFLEEINGRRYFELNLTNLATLYRATDEQREELFTTLGMKSKAINSDHRIMYSYPSDGKRKNQFVVIDKVRGEVSIGYKLANPKEEIPEIEKFKNEHSDDYIVGKDEYHLNYGGVNYGVYARKIGNMKMLTLYSLDSK